MDTKNIMTAFREVRRMWKNGVVYNITVDGKKIIIKEKSMTKKLTVNDAMAAIATLTTTINNLVTTVTQGFKAVQSDIARLDNKIDDVETRLNNKIDAAETRLNNKIDNIVQLNNLKT